MVPNSQGSTEPLPGGLKRWGWRLASTVLTLGVTWLILRGAGFRLSEAADLDLSMVQLDPALLTASVAVVLAAFVVQAWLWSRIAADLGEPAVPLGLAASLVLVANLGRYVPGKVVQLAGLAVLARRAGLSAVRAGAAAVTGQILNLLAAASLGGWVIYGSSEMPRGPALVTGFAALLVLACLLFFGAARPLLHWALRRAGHDDELPRSGGARLLVWFAGYLLSWLVYGLAFYLLGAGLGLDVPLAVATTAFAGAYLAGYLAWFAPAGVGVREGILLALLTPVLGPSGGLVLAGMQRVWITVAELAGAAAGAVILRKPTTGDAA